MKKTIVTALIAVIIAAAAFIYFGNNSIITNKITVTPHGLPEGFNGFKIAHLSDLHNKNFGGKLSGRISALSPDIIVITGDIIDSHHTDTQIAIDFIKEISGIAPIYYVTGNHESRVDEYEELKKEMLAEGVNILDNKTVMLEKNGDEIALCGIDDLGFFGSDLLDENRLYFYEKLEEIFAETNGKTSILLTHKPHYFDKYAETGYNLVFCGHAHGGQARLPFIGGLYAPGQGFFPEYTSGIHSKGNTEMVISRGLGNSLFPFRIFNRPEIVLCELLKEK